MKNHLMTMTAPIVRMTVMKAHVMVIKAPPPPPQSEKLLLLDTVQSELEEKIRRLEEDRHSIDITSGQAPTRPHPCPT